MSSFEITEDTSVQEVLDAKNENQRALMSRLAMTVFNRFGGGTLRAFTQFSFKDLAAVIEAHRKGVFNYGLTIRDGSNGPSWPRDAGAVMTAIDDAMQGRDVDLASLNVLDSDGSSLVDLTKLFPSVAIKQQASGKPETPPKVEKPKVVEKKAEKPKVVEQKAGKVLPMRSRESVAKTDEEPANDNAILARIDRLSNGLADGLDAIVGEVKRLDQGRASVIEDELGYVKNETENIKAGILGLFGVLEVVDRNQRKILDWIVGEGVIEFETLPSDAIDMIRLAVPEDLEERLETDEPVVDPLPDEPQGEVRGDGEDTKWYTREDLESMNLEDLRALAGSIGVDPARWTKTNVNRILEEQDRQRKAAS